MDPTREQTYQFLDGFIGEMARLFPDPYFHIGGDEVNGKQWRQSAGDSGVRQGSTAWTGAAHLQLYFNQRISKILAQHGKTMVGWDEILQPELPTGTVIQTWRGRSRWPMPASRAIAAFCRGATISTT